LLLCHFKMCKNRSNVENLFIDIDIDWPSYWYINLLEQRVIARLL